MRSLTRPTVLHGALATHGLLCEGYREEGEVPVCWVLSCRADRTTRRPQSEGHCHRSHDRDTLCPGAPAGELRSGSSKWAQQSSRGLSAGAYQDSKGSEGALCVRSCGTASG